jgi:ribosomal protein S18 acetylase RimI-like enzyme
MGAPQELVDERLERGSRAFAGWEAGELVCYGWVSTGSECIGELATMLRLAPGHAYVWDCATLPAHRRRGLYTELLRVIVARLGAEGLLRLWIGASLSNGPSLRAFASAGFTPVLVVTHARLGGLCWTRTHGWEAAAGPLVTAAREALDGRC